MQIQTITVIGANGNMGRKVAGVFAALGGARVYMVSRELEASCQAIGHAAQSVRDESVQMIPADYSALAECLGKSDLVFESVAEDLTVKRDLLRKMIPYIRKDCILCTGTSGLSVAKLAQELPEDMRGRFFGVHFFNPPYQLRLCEVITTRYTDPACCTLLKAWLRDKLLRQVVEVKDSPAFLCNRIGLYCINEAARYAEQYSGRGGIDYVDSVLGTYTGRSMPPLVTADFIGLDVHKAVCDYIHGNVCDYASDAFVLPGYMDQLITGGKLGKKSRAGLYGSITDGGGNEVRAAYDCTRAAYRPVEAYRLPYVQRMNALIRDGRYDDAYRVLLHEQSDDGALCVEFLLKYVLYALYCVDDLGNTADDGDVAMAEGFNWCPPQAMLGLLGGKDDLAALVKERLPDVAGQVDLERLTAAAGVCRLDFRRYIRVQK